MRKILPIGLLGTLRSIMNVETQRSSSADLQYLKIEPVEDLNPRYSFHYLIIISCNLFLTIYSKIDGGIQLIK